MNRRHFWHTTSEELGKRLNNRRLPEALQDVYLGELFRRARSGDTVAKQWFTDQIAKAEDYLEKGVV